MACVMLTPGVDEQLKRVQHLLYCKGRTCPFTDSGKANLSDLMWGALRILEGCIFGKDRQTETDK